MLQGEGKPGVWVGASDSAEPHLHHRHSKGATPATPPADDQNLSRPVHVLARSIVLTHPRRVANALVRAASWVWERHQDTAGSADRRKQAVEERKKRGRAAGSGFVFRVSGQTASRGNTVETQMLRQQRCAFVWPFNYSSGRASCAVRPEALVPARKRHTP
jgi:hypothetical protein